MTGFELADFVVTQYKTTNVFLIAKLTGVKIDYAHWHPITYGEFDKKTQSIKINNNVQIIKRQILAHELSRYFSLILGLSGDKKNEELRAEEFASYF